jgi:peptidoglycan lytic transglycosylase D
MAGSFVSPNNNFYSMSILRTALVAGSLVIGCLGAARAEDEAPPFSQVPAVIAEADNPTPGAASPEWQAATAYGHAVPESVWERIRNGFAMPDFDNALVRDTEAWYSARPDYVRRMVERSKRYLFYVVEEAEKRGMPTEIALLPMIESAYNPMAYSPANAVGIWQFVPATGRTYGLKQNWWFDARRDVIAATNAALDYLQDLYAMFNDWELALAAYNWGEGSVARALFRNQARGLPIDYHSLRMPAETRAYIPKLMAVKNIVRNPAAYGLDLDPVPNQPYFEAVRTTRDMDVKTAARLAEIPTEEFLALNAGHSRPVIPANEPQTLLLPVEKVATFLGNLDSHVKPLSSWQIYYVRPGEKLATIAAHFGLTSERLKEINGIPVRGKLQPVHTLLVPLKPGAEESGIDTAGFVAPAVETRASAKLAAKKGGKPVKTAAVKGKPSAKRGPAKPVMLVDARGRAR